MMSGALARYRICDFTGQLAGAGATKWLAAFGAEVIRIEDPVRQGRWDILRGMDPFVDDRRGIDLGGAFNNHNSEKQGITLNLRTPRAREILTEIIRESDAVTENFAAGVLERWGFGYDAMRTIRPDIVYVSNCGFGHVGPYEQFKSWGPIVQAISGLTFTSALPEQPPAGWGYSYMDHTGAYYMAIALLLALIHRERTGEGQWVDLACTEAALTLHGTALLDWTVNHRPLRQEVAPSSNRSAWLPMAPHGIYPAAGEDEWVAIACRSDADWQALQAVAGEPWCREPGWDRTVDRVADQDRLDAAVGRWTMRHHKLDIAERLHAAGVPASAVLRPDERIDRLPGTREFGLWPTVRHREMGEVRIDGLPVHLSQTDWRLERGAPCLGEHTEEVLERLLGIPPEETARLREEGVV
jgi:benzylsuccinate CoA-transferase BbsF subunit